jgi:hypothetical protein
VTKLGNDTMLNFGYAMLKQKPAFTFPRAKNLRENRKVAIDNKQIIPIKGIPANN